LFTSTLCCCYDILVLCCCFVVLILHCSFLFCIAQFRFVLLLLSCIVRSHLTLLLFALTLGCCYLLLPYVVVHLALLLLVVVHPVLLLLALGCYYSPCVVITLHSCTHFTFPCVVACYCSPCVVVACWSVVFPPSSHV
jgi:hypothetical protein